MVRRRSANRLAAALVAALMATPAQGEELVASMTAALQLLQVDAERPIRPQAGQPVRLRVTLTDVTTNRAPEGVRLAGWVRPVAGSAGSCQDAARAFRATRAIPLGATDLNGVLLVSLNEDASVGVIDPRLNLASSNMLAAARLRQMPDAMAVDARRMRAIFAIDGALTAMGLLTGDLGALDSPLPAPHAVAALASGAVWIGSRDGRMAPLNGSAGPVLVGDGKVALRPGGGSSTLLAAFAENGGMVVIDAATGREVLRRDGPALDDLVLAGETTILAMPRGTGRAQLIYADAPGHAVDIPLDFPAQHLRASPDGRFAIAFATEGDRVALIDLSLGQVVQRIRLDAGRVSDAGFTTGAAHILSLDSGFVGVVALDAVAPGREAPIHHVDLGRTGRPARAGAKHLVPLWPSPRMLAVDPTSGTAWIIHEISAKGETPPMDAVRMRGGQPYRLAVADRSFREIAPGRFEAVTALPGGEQELVLTTGIGGLTACMRFLVEGGDAAAAPRPLTLEVADAGGFRAGEEQMLTFTFRDDKGDEIMVDQVQFLVPSLVSSWSNRITARRDAAGRLTARVRLPHAGPYAIKPLDLPAAWAMRAAPIIGVSP